MRNPRWTVVGADHEICPYRPCAPTDPKFLAQVTEPELLVIAGEALHPTAATPNATLRSYISPV
jgi:hypothetical protein